jgi:hypothetical protein
MGGAISLALSLRMLDRGQPERIAGLLLLAPAVKVPKLPPWCRHRRRRRRRRGRGKNALVAPART